MWNFVFYYKTVLNSLNISLYSCSVKLPLHELIYSSFSCILSNLLIRCFCSDVLLSNLNLQSNPSKVALMIDKMLIITGDRIKGEAIIDIIKIVDTLI